MNSYLKPTFTLPNHNHLAKHLAQKTHIPFLEWFQVLKVAIPQAQSAKIDPDAFLLITENTNTPQQLSLIIRLLAQLSQALPAKANSFNTLYTYTRNSSYSLHEWLMAIEFIHTWAHHRNLNTSLTHILPYIHNALKTANSGQSGLSLRLILSKSLALVPYSS